MRKRCVCQAVAHRDSAAGTWMTRGEIFSETKLPIQHSQWPCLKEIFNLIIFPCNACSFKENLQFIYCQVQLFENRKPPVLVHAAGGRTEHVADTYLAAVGQLHQLAHEGSGLRALRFSHLLHLQVALCARANVTSAWVRYSNVLLLTAHHSSLILLTV